MSVNHSEGWFQGGRNKGGLEGKGEERGGRRVGEGGERKREGEK